MTDRELLEAAAKAAGIKLVFDPEAPVADHSPRLEGSRYVWNPLEDDGDALRLAVKLGLLNYRTELVTVLWAARKVADPMAATRRAIVRAAAAIGSQHD